MVRIGSVSLIGTGYPLPRERSRAKQTLKSIAKMCGVKAVYFVRTTKANHSGYYGAKTATIVVVEKDGASVIPMWKVAFRFFHELTHHLHREGGIFEAYYDQEGKYTKAAGRRVALRAEKHANQKACELTKEFFGIELKTSGYPGEFMRSWRWDLFE